MEEILKCNLCKFTYDNHIHEPKLIICGHTFCSSCIVNRSNEMPCPICGKFLNFRIESSFTNYLVLDIVNCFNLKNRESRQLIINTVSCPANLNINIGNSTTVNVNSGHPTTKSTSLEKNYNYYQIKENDIILGKFF